MLNWQYFPKSREIPPHLKDVVDVFSSNLNRIDSQSFTHNSDQVLEKLSRDLKKKGFIIEKSKKAKDKISVPVLFGKNGIPEKTFNADGIQKKTNTVLEIEAGRGVTNNQFLKDLFEACMMHEIDYLIIALRNIYLETNKDYNKVITFFETMYASGRLALPLKGILVIGY
ncbi:MAG: hypothetical protein WC541_00130 [Dehalococcoidia bacterium]